MFKKVRRAEPLRNKKERTYVLAQKQIELPNGLLIRAGSQGRIGRKEKRRETKTNTRVGAVQEADSFKIRGYRRARGWGAFLKIGLTNA